MKTILIIEDEPQIRNNIQELLYLSDFDTLVAENGLQGLELAQDQHPDLIICDLMMPDLDGYGVLIRLRQNSYTATIPIIFLTAKSEWSDLRRGMELGADDYLTKPFQPDQLLQAITVRLNKQAISKQQTQEKLNTLSQCISHSIPHEINTPLNHILGISELLIQQHREFSHEEISEMLESIYKAGKRLHKLTINFLMYADIELLASNPEKVALNVAQNSNREADLSIDISDAIVKLSSAKLSKIVEEIIDNAFKFSEPNTPIKIIGSSYNNTFRLFIIDHGRGMTEEQINNVGAYIQFERKMYEQQGSGLGLLIAKTLVELHGGEFLIESIYEKQTIIRIVLPR
jgi:two-component system, sensor histidine kinase and response regulator